MKIYGLRNITREDLRYLTLSDETPVNFQINSEIQDLQLKLKELEIVKEELSRTQAKNLVSLRIKSIHKRIKQLESRQSYR